MTIEKEKSTHDEAGKQKRTAGRPPKFEGPCRPITVTLPEKVLQMLEAVNKDRSKAITKVTHDSVTGTSADHPLVRLVKIDRDVSLIIVGHSKRLRELPWLRRIEIAPGQFLLSLATGTSVETLELAIIDLIAELKPEEEHERHLLEQLQHHIAHPRRERRLSRTELLLVHT